MYMDQPASPLCPDSIAVASPSSMRVAQMLALGKISLFNLPVRGVPANPRLRHGMQTRAGWMLSSEFARGGARSLEHPVADPIVSANERVGLSIDTNGMVGPALGVPSQCEALIGAVQLRRLQDLTAKDAMGFGVWIEAFDQRDATPRYRNPASRTALFKTARDAYVSWLEAAVPGLWGSNPWVWAVRFKVLGF